MGLIFCGSAGLGIGIARAKEVLKAFGDAKARYFKMPLSLFQRFAGCRRCPFSKIRCASKSCCLRKHAVIVREAWRKPGFHLSFLFCRCATTGGASSEKTGWGGLVILYDEVKRFF